jgi:hypothetical protein
MIGLGIVPLHLALSLLSLVAIGTGMARFAGARAELAKPSVTVVVKHPSSVEAVIGKLSSLRGVAGISIPGPLTPLIARELSDLLGGYNERAILLVVSADLGFSEFAELTLTIRGLPEVEEVGANPRGRADLQRNRALGTAGLAAAAACAWLCLLLAAAHGTVAFLRETLPERRLLLSLGAAPTGLLGLLGRRGVLPLLALWGIPWGIWMLLPLVASLPGPGVQGTALWFAVGATALPVGTVVGAALGRRWR